MWYVAANGCPAPYGARAQGCERGVRLVFGRLLGIVFKRIATSRPFVLLILALQVLYLLPALSQSVMGGWQGPSATSEVESIRMYRSSQSVDPDRYPSGSAMGSWHLANDIKMADAADQLLECWDNGDANGYFAAAAEYYRTSAEVQGYAGSVYNLDRAALYQALADSGATQTYTASSDAPALIYAAAGGKGLLMFPGGMAPLIYSPEGDGVYRYNEQVELLFWTLPLLAVSTMAASIQTKQRLVTQAPVGTRRRMFYGVAASAVACLVVLGLICAPALILQAVRVGLGDASYPVAVGSGASLVVSTVGETLLKSAALYLLIALMLSLLAHVSASLFDSVAPAVVVTLCMMALPLAPDYFGEFSAYRKVAPWLPSTYLWVEYAAGSIGLGLLPGSRPLLGITFIRGCASLGLAVAVLAVLLAVLAPMGALVSWTSRPRRAVAAQGASRSQAFAPVAVSPASAYASVDVRAPRHACPRASSLSVFATYTAALARMLLSGPALYVLVFIMAAALIVPAVFSVDPDVSGFSPESYKNGQLRDLYAQLESGAYAQGSDEYDMLRRQADALSGYVYSETAAKGYASLAEYERLRLEAAGYGDNASALGEPADVTALAEGDPVDDPLRVRAKIALLEGLASVEEPELYSMSTRMPASFYLSFVFGAAPFAFWLAPACAASLLIARYRCKGSLVQQAPVSFGVELGAGCVVAAAIALVMLVLVIVPGTAYASMRNGVGQLGYPVVFIQSGGVVATTVACALASAAGMQALASTFVVVFLACVERATRSFRSVCAAAIMLLALTAVAANASVLAPDSGLASMVFGWLPFTYLDVARVVGAAGYTFITGCGISVFAGCVVLASSLPVLVLIACLFNRVRSHRSQRVRESSCVIRI